jgi:MFS family permease
MAEDAAAVARPGAPVQLQSASRANVADSFRSLSIGNERMPVGKVVSILMMNLLNTAFYLMTYPFAAFMVASFFPHLAATELGFYTGLLEASFHVGQLVGALVWGALSDVIGRRPVLLSGLLWTAISCTLFGLSTSFPMAVGCVRGSGL